MINKQINLSENYPNIRFTSYVHEEASAPRTTVVVCPGGGYSGLCADREGEHTATFYYEQGFNAFVLEYSVGKAIENYSPTIQVALAVKYVREHADEYNTDPNKIVTCGFSAGGHLAGSAGILWNMPEVKEALADAPEGINRPNGMILCYPVITGGEFAHRGSIANLSKQPNYGADIVEKLSLERHIDSTTPPLFIWHTANDTCVPVQNSLMLIAEYAKNKVPFEAHIYPCGPHGMGLSTDESCKACPALIDPHVATWAKLSVMWLRDMFK